MRRTYPIDPDHSALVPLGVAAFLELGDDLTRPARWGQLLLLLERERELRVIWATVGTAILCTAPGGVS